MTGRAYPGEPTGPLEAPPRTCTDEAGREIALRAYDGEREAVLEMYREFDPEDRAQGIPPAREESLREWLDTILGEDCVNVFAWHGDRVVGHATLVPDDGDYELAIFVLGDYQGAGIGTALMRALLARGREVGVERVWLTVERWNQPAIALYRKVGFEPVDAESFELEMALSLH